MKKARQHMNIPNANDHDVTINFGHSNLHISILDSNNKSVDTLSLQVQLHLSCFLGSALQ